MGDGDGGYLDGVDDEAGQEEEQAEREHDEHERDRHGRPPQPLPISEGSDGRRRWKEKLPAALLVRGQAARRRWGVAAPPAMRRAGHARRIRRFYYRGAGAGGGWM